MSQSSKGTVGSVRSPFGGNSIPSKLPKNFRRYDPATGTSFTIALPRFVITTCAPVLATSFKTARQ